MVIHRQIESDPNEPSAMWRSEEESWYTAAAFGSTFEGISYLALLKKELAKVKSDRVGIGGSKHRRRK